MLLRSTQKIWEKFIENFLQKSRCKFTNLHCSRLPGQLIMQNQSQRLCSMWHLVELFVFTSSASVFAEARAVWCQAGLVGGAVVVNRFSETYWFYLFLMIIPLIKCWSKSWWTSLIHFAYSIHGKHHPCAKLPLGPTMQLGSWTD